MPRVIIGAVTMKMIKSTRMTSTRGVTLMSDSDGPKRPRPRAGMFMPMEWLRLRSESDLGRLGGGRGGPSGLDLRIGDRDEVEDETIDAAAQAARPGHENVVPDDRRDGREQSRRRGHQRLGDPGRDGRQAGRAGDPDPLKGVHDAPHRPEQPDERRHGTRGREDAEMAVEVVRLAGRGFLETPADALQDPV